jgi:ABC-type uncharacterized transport system ATPase subunit
VFEGIGFLFLEVVLEVDSDKVGHDFLLLPAEQVEADIHRGRQLAALRSHDIDVAQNTLQVVVLHPQKLRRKTQRKEDISFGAQQILQFFHFVIHVPRF